MSRVLWGGGGQSAVRWAEFFGVGGVLWGWAEHSEEGGVLYGWVDRCGMGRSAVDFITGVSVTLCDYMMSVCCSVPDPPAILP